MKTTQRENFTHKLMKHLFTVFCAIINLRTRI